jgi:hypothetical protein
METLEWSEHPLLTAVILDFALVRSANFNGPVKWQSLGSLLTSTSL